MNGINRLALIGDISIWLKEDIGHGDITSELTIPLDAIGEGVILTKQGAVIAGLEVAKEVFMALDLGFDYRPLVADGYRASAGEVLVELSGRARAILAGERLALNLLQRLSGIATKTAAFVAETEGTKAKILDSRKTTPGLRNLEKYAVRVGGGQNHRFGLFDGILIKDNHVAAAGSTRAAVIAAKTKAPHYLVVEVEVTNLEELEEALVAGADCILLDNMSSLEMAKAAEFVAGRVPLEASGDMSLERIREVAATGVDFISVGALTHSAQAVDISLDFNV